VTAPSANRSIESATAALSLSSPAAPVAALVAPRATTPAPPAEIAEDEDDPSVSVAPGTLCKRPGCRKPFVSDEESRQGDGEEAQCNYHASQVRSNPMLSFTISLINFDDFSPCSMRAVRYRPSIGDSASI
jgi:hypothetical protein